MPHTCHAIGCDVAVPPKIFMCKPHWFKLPKPIRDGIWSAFKPGQERTKTPSNTYLINSYSACIWLAEQEGLGDHGRTNLYREALEIFKDKEDPSVSDEIGMNDKRDLKTES